MPSRNVLLTRAGWGVGNGPTPDDTERARDRLVALKKARKKLITQREAAAELGVSERQVRRLLRALKERGDKAVIPAGRGRKSNRKLAEEKHKKAIEILSREVYRGFGPP